MEPIYPIPKLAFVIHTFAVVIGFVISIIAYDNIKTLHDFNFYNTLINMENCSSLHYNETINSINEKFITDSNSAFNMGLCAYVFICISFGSYVMLVFSSYIIFGNIFSGNKQNTNYQQSNYLSDSHVSND